MSILEKYEPAVREAITLFWNTRDTQIQKQIEKNVVDRGMRAGCDRREATRWLYQFNEENFY